MPHLRRRRTPHHDDLEDFNLHARNTSEAVRDEWVSQYRHDKSTTSNGTLFGAGIFAQMVTRQQAAHRGLRTSATPEEQHKSIVAAATDEFTRVGVRQANMDLIAQRAQVSRTTLYRRFPSKDALLTAVAEAVSAGIVSRLVEVVAGHSPQDAIVEAFHESICQLRTNPLVRALVVDDPATVSVIFNFTRPGMETLLDQLSRSFAHALIAAGAKMPPHDLRIVAEVAVRLTISLEQTTSNAVDLTDATSIREFAQKFIAPTVW